MANSREFIALFVAVTICVASRKANASCSKIMNFGTADWKRASASDVSETIEYRFDLEILEGVFLVAGCQFTLKSVPTKRLQEAIRYGEIDATMGASLNIARQQYAWFTKAYRRETMGMFMLSDKISTFKPKSLVDLQNSKLRIGLGIGAWHGEKFEGLVATDRDMKKRMLYSDDFRILFQLLRRDRVDIVLMDINVGSHLLKLIVSPQKISAHPFPVHTGELHLMLSRKTVSKADALTISDAVALFRGTKAYREITKKYSSID